MPEPSKSPNAPGNQPVAYHGDTGAAVGVLVMWPLLAGACLISRG